MDPVIILLALATFFSTLIGGTVALRFRRALPYFFAFAAGTLVTVAFLDLLPESLQLSQSIGLPIRDALMAVVLSFLFYSFVERYFLTHHHHEERGDEHGHPMGQIGAGSLVVHSLLDGVAIGAAFNVNPAVGIIVALAVIFHDFTDGINTVVVVLKNKHRLKTAIAFLVSDAIAPVIGVLLTYLFILNSLYLAVLLAIFVGEFLYIGATSILPETYKHTPWKMMLMMALGVVLIITLTSIV
ncbi:MAG: ZIP family metal transporter [Candidatus Micrarchaeota archaeon]|nr:ZIP family metal transporter [Candidatus Micrarchaeota archaeon]